MYGDQFGEFVCGFWGLKRLFVAISFVPYQNFTLTGP